jgi:gliding motility-associated-like protein/uncharacterized delta-60 repeat protein
MPYIFTDTKTMKKIILLSILFISSTGLWAQSTSNLGYLDTTFNSKGPIRGDKYMNIGAGTRALSLDDQGRIVMAACSGTYSQFIYVFRLKPNGAFDKPFGLTTSDSIAKIQLSTFGISYGYCSSLVIQKDGKFVIGGTDNANSAMIVIRLNADGTLDKTFDTDGLLQMNPSAGVDQINDIAVQSTGKIIVSGTSSGKIIVFRINADGSKDTAFNSFTSANTSTEAAAGLELINDTIVVGGSYSAGASVLTYYYSVIKLSPNGGGTGLVWRKDIALSPNPTTSNIGDVAVQTNGKIIVGGGDYSAIRAYRLNHDGSIDNTFGAGGIFLQNLGMGPTLKNIVIEKDGKIDFTGSYSGNYVIVRTKTTGSLDSTFGALGQLIIYTANYPSTAKGILSIDQKLWMAGDMSTSTEIIKVELNPVFHVFGNTYTFPKSIEKYKVKVPSYFTGINYLWTYSGQNASIFPNVTSDSISIAYTDIATSGTLTCTIKNASGILIGIAQEKIVINKKPSGANQLQKTTCATKLTNCSIGYIDFFSLNNITNAKSGCSNNGYSDYTQSGYIDTLAAGGVYTAKLLIPNSGTDINYAAVWIDYDNDGDFSLPEEFMGEAYSNTSTVEVRNIVLKNKEGFEGPKRLRVRSRPLLPFSATESCPTQGENGETEDYLVTLQTQPVMEAPQIITPNEDGKNDFFVIRGMDPGKAIKVTIFDRIGAVKFSSSNYQNDWNGKGSNGETINPGTYYYVATTGKVSLKGFLEVRY